MTEISGYGLEIGGDDDDYWFAPCPRCDRPAEHGCYEEIVGSVNLYMTVNCCHCGCRSVFDWLAPC